MTGVLDDVLHLAVVVIIAGATVAFLLVFLHGWREQRDRVHYARVEVKLRGPFLLAIQGERHEAGLDSRLNRVPVRHRTRLLMQVARLVRGEERARLTRFAARTGVLQQAARATRSSLWWRRLHAVRVFTATGGGENEVPALLADPHPLVRSEAASWCAGHPRPENIRRLLNLMDTPSMADRIAVIDALVSIGPPALRPLADHLQACTEEGRKAGLTAALGLAHPLFLPPALAAVRDPAFGVRVQAARLLSILGGEQAVEAITRLLEDDRPVVRAAAARGLGRLGACSAAGSLELLLADRHPDPRRDAALALAELGASGWVLLRETARLGGPAGRLANAALESLGTPVRVLEPVEVEGRAAS